jgi:hypothetical protein
MAEGKPKALDFDKYLSLSEKEMHKAAVASNDAFVLAMARAVQRGREKVTVGTYVDLSPPIGHVRIRGDTIFSACGSPAAMCLDVGSDAGGAQTMK